MLLGLLNKLLKLTKPSFHPQNGFVPLELICPDYSQHLIVYDARERFTHRSAVYRACHARFLQSTTQPEFPTQGLSHHETSRQEWRPSLRVLDNNCPRSILCVMRREWDARSQRWFCASSPTCAHYTRVRRKTTQTFLSCSRLPGPLLTQARLCFGSIFVSINMPAGWIQKFGGSASDISNLQYSFSLQTPANDKLTT